MRVNIKRTKYVHEYHAHAVRVAHQAHKMCARSVHLYIRYMNYMLYVVYARLMCANIARAKFVWRIRRTDLRVHIRHILVRVHM